VAFADWLMPLRQCEWVVYAKRPFAAPEAVLAYLSRYTHRVAISNSRLVTADDRGVTFRWKDYREHGRTRHKTMTLGTAEFMRRFLLHVLPPSASDTGARHRARESSRSTSPPTP
jgi:Putative transposase